MDHWLVWLMLDAGRPMKDPERAPVRRHWFLRLTAPRIVDQHDADGGGNSRSGVVTTCSGGSTSSAGSSGEAGGRRRIIISANAGGPEPGRGCAYRTALQLWLN